MKSILSELYAGNIFPAEQYSPRSEEYRRIHQRNYQHYDNFIETLSKLEPPLDKQFIKIMDEQLEKLFALSISGFAFFSRYSLPSSMFPASGSTCSGTSENSASRCSMFFKNSKTGILFWRIRNPYFTGIPKNESPKIDFQRRYLEKSPYREAMPLIPRRQASLFSQKSIREENNQDHAS